MQNDVQVSSEILEALVQKLPLNKMESILVPNAGMNHLVDILSEKLCTARFGSSAHKDLLDIDTTEVDDIKQFNLKQRGFNVIHNNFISLDTMKQYDGIVFVAIGDTDFSVALKATRMLQIYGGWIAGIIDSCSLHSSAKIATQFMAILNLYNAEIEYYKNIDDRELVIILFEIPSPCVQSVLLRELENTPYVEQEIPEEELVCVPDYIVAATKRFAYEAKAGTALIREYFSMQPFFYKPDKKHIITSYANIHELQLVLACSYAKGEDPKINNYLESLRLNYWCSLFTNKKFTNRLPSKVLEKYYKEVNDLKKLDFTLFNIRSLQCEMMKKAITGIETTILKVFDDFSSRHKDFSESGKSVRYFEGWKTNSSYKVNKKVIIRLNAWGYSGSYWPLSEIHVSDYITDLERIFAYLAGAPVDMDAIYGILRNAQDNIKHKDIEFKYFSVNFYKKGTAHIIFKNDELLKRFNIFAAQHKCWLPPSYGKVDFEDMQSDEQKVILDFGGIEDYRDTMQKRDYYLSKSTLALEAPVA